MTEVVAVTGAAGFIGSHVVDALLARGTRVIGIDNLDDFYDPAMKRANLAEAGRNPRFTLAEADIRDAEVMRRTFVESGTTAIIHLAARAGVRPSIAKPELYADVNVRGTMIVLEAARVAGVRRLIVASSSSVYGNSSKPPFREDDPALHPVSPYAATKRAGELLCETYAHLYPDLRLISLRFFTVYGPRQRPDLAIRKFANLIADGRPVPVFGDGSFARDYTYITDIVDGVLAALDRTRNTPVRHELFNLGATGMTTVLELVRLLERALGRTATIEHHPPQPGDVERTCADVSRAGATLGYRPRVAISEGIERFVGWFEEQHRATARRGA